MYVQNVIIFTNGPRRRRRRAWETEDATMTIKLNKEQKHAISFELIWLVCVCVCVYTFSVFFLFLLCFALFQLALNFILNERISSFHAIKQFSIWIWIELSSCCFACAWGWGQLIIFTTQDKLCCHKIYLHINLSFDIDNSAELDYTNANLLT